MTHNPGLLIVALATSLGGAPTRAPLDRTPFTAQPSCSNHAAATENIAAQLAKFRPVQMPFSTTGLSTSEVQMVRKLIEAGQYLESAFWRESDPEGLRLYQALTNCPGATEQQIRH